MKSSVYLKKNSANTFFFKYKEKRINIFVHRLIVIFPRFCLYIDI